ncbi:MAG: glycosyltransferase family 2 protein [Chloroflexota bacterium]
MPGQSPACRCSIVIPAFNKWFYTRMCLLGLSQTLAGRFDFEVIIVDNASTDETADRLRELALPYRVLTNSQNLGFARACNQGAAAATGEYLLFLNNDTVPTEGWLDALLRVAEGGVGVGIVGSKLLYPDGTIQHAGVAISDELIPMHMYCLFPADYAEASVNQEYQAVTGACLLLRRFLFEELGGFDERYLNSYEDIDLCCRVRRRNLKVVYAADSVLYHFESISSGRHEQDDANQQLFLSRWSGFIQADQRARYLAAGFADVPRVPGTTVCEVQAQLSDERRLGRELRHCLAELSLAGPARPVGSASPGAAWANLPPIMAAGQSAEVTVAIANLGDAVWRAGEGWFASHQWLSEGGTPLSQEEHLALECDVCGGQVASLNVAITAPGQPGAYQLRWGLGRQLAADRCDGVAPLATQSALVGRLYGAEYAGSVPRIMAAGEQRKLMVFLRNTGARPWLGNAAFALSYHWYDASGCAVVDWDGPRAPVGERVVYGDAVAIPITVTAPKLGGDYVLGFDMLEEGRIWFSWAGAPEFRSPVRVSAGLRHEERISAATALGLTALGLREPVLRADCILSEEVVELLRAKDRQIGELLALVETLQPLRALVRECEQSKLELGRQLSAMAQRASQLEAEVDAIRRGRLLRALESFHRWRRRWRP